MKNYLTASILLIMTGLCSCRPIESEKISVIFDTDTNNELDDQHALAYLLFNTETFDILGITVNATTGGGSIDNHYAEAHRVLQLCNRWGKIPLLKGANGNFNHIEKELNSKEFDGAEAVDFIIEKALKSKQIVTVIAVGKLTNVALALMKNPEIAKKIRIVWLGSNYPAAGEYNLANDIEAMNYVLQTDVLFEMVTVRYMQSLGTHEVMVSPEEIKQKMAGVSPVTLPVTGRDGKKYSSFGDYSIALFEQGNRHSATEPRPLYDVAAVAIVKNSNWAKSTKITAPQYIDGEWKNNSENQRTIILWENFNKNAIIRDFFETMNHAIQ